MTIQILTLYLKPNVCLTGAQQAPACREILSALSAQLKITGFHQVTFDSTQVKTELLIGLQPTATSLEVSASSALHEPLFPYSESLPYIRYLATNNAPDTFVNTNGLPCDILTLRFPPSTSPERQMTCLQALDCLLSASDGSAGCTDVSSPYEGRVSGYMKEEFGIAGGEDGVYRAYIMWKSREEAEVFKARHGGRHLWASLDEVGDRQWRDDMGFYDALEEIWATEGVDVESGWIKHVGKAEYKSRPARAISSAMEWMSSLGGRHGINQGRPVPDPNRRRSQPPD